MCSMEEKESTSSPKITGTFFMTVPYNRKHYGLRRKNSNQIAVIYRFLFLSRPPPSLRTANWNSAAWSLMHLSVELHAHRRMTVASFRVQRPDQWVYCRGLYWEHKPPFPTQIVHSQVCVPAAQLVVRNSRVESRFEQTTAIHTFAEATSSVQVQDISEKVCRKGRISGK